MRLVKKSAIKALSSTIFILPFLLVGCGSSTKSGTNDGASAASSEEMALYRDIGMSYFCISREAEVDFSKAIAIASTNFTAIIEKKHDGLIEELGEEKLSVDQIYNGTYFQLLEGAMQLCPNKVPEEFQEKYKDALKKIKASK